MKILFIAPNYMGLSGPIKQIMEELGHDVCFIEDITPSFYPYYRRRGVQRLLYNIILSFKNVDRKFINYWDDVISRFNLMDRHFDLLFCINGTSLHSYFFDKVIQINPTIKKVLYIWDTNKYYNFDWYLKYFDKAFTFDKSDAKELNIQYLPFYYIRNNNFNNKFKYDAFCIGSLHDGRLQILDMIASQLDKMNLNYLFKVVYTPIDNTLLNRLILYFRRLFDSELSIIEREYKMGIRTHKFLSNTPTSINDYNQLMSQSRVIIDTDRQSQVGLTPRLVWAIASGKSIITTNSNVKNCLYCPTDRIWIIDRESPIIFKSMFEERQFSEEFNTNIKKLEIQNWITNFLSI